MGIYNNWFNKHGSDRFQLANIEFVLKSIERSAPPIYHAFSSDDCGVGTEKEFGHLKLSNDNDTFLAAAASYSGMALSVKQGYILSGYIKSLDENKSPIPHDSVSTKYGVGTDIYYGHLKVYDTLLSTNPSSGAALSAYQGYVLKSGLDGKAPTSHASSSSGYGLGTTSSYGHVKLISNLTQQSYANGCALSAEMGYNIQTQLNDRYTKAQLAAANITFTGTINVNTPAF
jgi:hypothetical protein